MYLSINKVNNLSGLDAFYFPRNYQVVKNSLLRCIMCTYFESVPANASHAFEHRPVYTHCDEGIVRLYKLMNYVQYNTVSF